MKVLLLFIVLANSVFSQNNIEKCGLEKNINTEKIFVLNDSTFECLVKANRKKIFYSYAFWCKPCVEKLPEVIDFCNQNGIELYILLIHSQDSKEMKIENDRFKNEDLNVLVLSDDYGKRPRKKYKNFLSTFYDDKIIDDMSKIILFDEKGNFKYISDWTDGENVLEEKIKPLLEN